MLKFSEFLLVNTSVCANFLLEKSGIEFIAVFLSILWSNLTILCCNSGFVLSTCACFLSFLLFADQLSDSTIIYLF